MAGSDAVWPAPIFYFWVQFGGGRAVAFQEVSGLENESKPADYRAGPTGGSHPIQMPGLRKGGNATLRKGLASKDAELFDWYRAIQMNRIERRTVVIQLVDEKGAPQMSWTLHDAFPTKITGTDLRAEGDEVALEAVEIAFETMETKTP